MVINTLAITTILFREPGWEVMLKAMEQEPLRLLAMPSALELHRIFEARLGDQGERELEVFLRKADIRKVALDEGQLKWAGIAFQKFGKGRHSAGLNFGDCFSYALAKTMGEKLLFKGNDLSCTDVEPLLPSHKLVLT
jgi:ribonuclease VapC